MSHARTDNTVMMEYVDDSTMPLLSEVVSELRNESEIIEFLGPVKCKGNYLSLYLDMIDTPMDLELIEQKLEDGAYLRVHELFDDLRLMWRNCKTYNEECSDLYKSADELEQKTHGLLKRFKAALRRQKEEKEAAGSDSSAPVECSSSESEVENPEERRRRKKNKKKEPSRKRRARPLQKHEDNKKRFPVREASPCEQLKRKLDRKVARRALHRDKSRLLSRWLRISDRDIKELFKRFKKDPLLKNFAFVNKDKGCEHEYRLDFSHLKRINVDRIFKLFDELQIGGLPEENKKDGWDDMDILY